MEPLYACSVISTVDNAVCTNLLFIGEEKETIANAEKAFLGMIKDEISDDLPQESLEQYLDDGYAISGNLCICINHPVIQ